MDEKIVFNIKGELLFTCAFSSYDAFESCNEIPAEWGGPVALALSGVWKSILASGRCCVMCNLALFRMLSAEREEEEDCKCDRGICLCPRLSTVCVCVWIEFQQSPDFYIFVSPLQ